jgi:hypothetical protein
VTCPRCQQGAGFHGFRPIRPLSLLGSLCCSRAYYLCRRCGGGLCPWDEAVGLSSRRQTPGVERAAALAGIAAGSFRCAADEVLWELAGVRLSESTVERVTEDAGRRLRAGWLAGATFGARPAWEWHLDYEGRRCAYVSGDATGVRQQAAGGGVAEGRMLDLAMVYNPVPEYGGEARPDRLQARYLAGFYSYEELGPILRRHGGQVGMDGADLWLGLCDAGSGLEAFLGKNFPRVEAVILDFYHAAEAVGELAALLHPQDAGAVQATHAGWCRLLKEEGGAVVIAVLREWEWPPGQPALRAKLDEVLGYFGNNVHRMEYPEYLARGWCIGTGPMESGCKQVGGRLKGTGMRWGKDGADGVAQLRALFLSADGQWDAFWSRQQNS